MFIQQAPVLIVCLKFTLIRLHCISIAQSFSIECRVCTNSFMSCLFLLLSLKFTVTSLQVWRNKNISHSLDDTCSEGTSFAKELPLPFITNVFNSVFEITLKDNFFMLKVSATRASRHSYLVFLPSSPLLTLAFLFYKFSVWVQHSKGQD